MTKPTDDKSQLHKFRDLARELEADEGEAAFEEQVMKVAANSPRPKPASDDQ